LNAWTPLAHTGVAFEDSSTGVAAARAAGTYLITVPSQPGKDLDGDYITTTLGDAVLINWAPTVGPLERAHRRAVSPANRASLPDS
jgi:hypothetical protein